VLLVDTSTAKRELRADAMRKLGMDVDCACDISEARSWWRADLYNLVLVNMENELEHRDKFCEDVRAATPPQQLVFLVGKPEYLADLPNVIEPALLESPGEENKTQAVETSDSSSVRWGIMEASRRISKVRSVSVARTTAMRNRPTPPRDLEVREPRRNDFISQLAAGLRKEDLL
jgi:CheY-like chemotaxis protein